MPANRRAFLKTAGATAAFASAAQLGFAGIPDGGTQQAAAAPPASRGLQGYQYVLELDGKPVDVVLGASGGFPFGKVSEYQAGDGTPAEKFISGVGFQDLVIAAGAGLSDELRGWMSDTLAGKGSHKNGSLHAGDFKRNVENTREFSHALLRAITFPACDASSKDPISLQLRIAPEVAQFSLGTGQLALPPALKQKPWLAANFRLTIPGLPTSRVSKVEALTVKQQVIEVREGGDSSPAVLVPGKIEYPNLSVTFAATDGGPWLEYFDAFVLSGSGSESEGTLEYLAPDLASSLLTIEFHHLGIITCGPASSGDGSEASQMLTAEFYMEGISLPAVQ